MGSLAVLVFVLDSISIMDVVGRKLVRRGCNCNMCIITHPQSCFTLVSLQFSRMSIRTVECLNW
jgi:hypothetical protein